MTKILKKVVPIKDDPKWTLLESSRKAITKDEVSVAFTNNANGSKTTVVRIGASILEKLDWKMGDKIGLFYDENEIYHWRLAKMQQGNLLQKEATNVADYMRIQYTWKNEGINFTKNKIVAHTIHKDSITFRVPLD